MKKTLVLLGFLALVSSCTDSDTVTTEKKVNWADRVVDRPLDAEISGSTYLSVYSEVYHLKEGRTHDLTVTVSLRNPNLSDTVYIHNARYFNTEGEQIRSYFEKTIYVAPMETVQIVIDENDREGGSGANFLFDWSIQNQSNEPIFEAVMISTSGQQGLSFTTSGVRLK